MRCALVFVSVIIGANCVRPRVMIFRLDRVARLCYNKLNKKGKVFYA